MAVHRMGNTWWTPPALVPVSSKVNRQPAAPIVCGQKQYVMRAWDTGLGQWVTWNGGSTPYYLTPVAAETSPPYTGTLQTPHVELVVILRQ